MDTIPVSARADLTDGQWAVLERLLPKGRKQGRPPKWSKRQLIDGIVAWPPATTKLAVRYEAGVQLAALSIWLRCLERNL